MSIRPLRPCRSADRGSLVPRGGHTGPEHWPSPFCRATDSGDHWCHPRPVRKNLRGVATEGGALFPDTLALPHLPESGLGGSRAPILSPCSWGVGHERWGHAVLRRTRGSLLLHLSAKEIALHFPTGTPQPNPSPDLGGPHAEGQRVPGKILCVLE